MPLTNQSDIAFRNLPFRSLPNGQGSTNNARFPYNLIHSGGTGDNEKFCLFIIKSRAVGNALRPAGYIALPFPQELDDSVNVTYTSSSFGIAGAAATGSLTNNFETDADKLTNALKKGLGSFNEDAFIKVATGLALKAAPGLKGAVNNATGTIENPFLTNTFSGVGFREFTFNFNLIPKNESDQIQLDNLLYLFKNAMMPTDKITRDGFTRNGLELFKNTGVQQMPDLFDVLFFPTTQSFRNTDSGNLLLKIKDSAITRFDVNFSGDTPSPVFYEDDSPFSASISMTLKESVIYTRERCQEDYSDILNELF
jgi:hypothetical protein